MYCLLSVTPQPVYVDPNEKHKHKFMVQSVVAPEGKTNIDQVVSITQNILLLQFLEYFYIIAVSLGHVVMLCILF